MTLENGCAVMSRSEMLSARPDHPWLSSFELDPIRRFDRIVRGVELIPPYGRADALTVIPSLFSPLDEADPLIGLLDDAAQAWISEWRQKSPDERLGYGFRRYVADAVTALRVVQLVNLAGTRSMLRDHFLDYLSWVDPLVTADSLDPRAALWFALAEEQPDLRFQFLWLRICREVGDNVLPQHYLNIGLLGLRRLPLEEQDRLERISAGLAVWAAGLGDDGGSQKRFQQQIRLLRWLFTRPNIADWHKLLEPILASYRDKPFTTWWTEEFKIASLRNRPTARRVVEPDRYEVDQVLRDVTRGGIEAIRRRINALIDTRVRWAEATGDVRHLVLSATRIVSSLIATDPNFALDVTRRALAWAPNDLYLWNLWGRSLAALGDADFAEAVFWEAVRRFPDNAASYVELGRLLAGLGRTEEALALLRETSQRFPDDGWSHAEFARVLATEGDLEGAIRILIDFDADYPDNAIIITLLGHLYVNRGTTVEALPLLHQLERIGGVRGLSELRRIIARSERGEHVPVPPYEYRVAVNFALLVNGTGESFRELRRDAAITSADFALKPEVRDQIPADRREESLARLRLVVDENKDYPYANLVWFDRGGATDDERQQMLTKFPKLLELHLAAAIRWSDGDAISRLLREHPEHSVLLWIAQRTTGGATQDSGDKLLHWLRAPAPTTHNLVDAYLHRQLHTILSQSGISVADATSSVLDEHRSELQDVVLHAVRMIRTLPIAA
jgi:tetratricopeptide (TPR) repeat protein